MQDIRFREYIMKVSGQFDAIADQFEFLRKKNYYYHQEIGRFYKDVVPKGKNVLEIGCACGNLLDELEPGYGVGLDISPKMIEIAIRKYPRINFIKSMIEDYEPGIKFDYVIISNLLEHIFDLYDFFNVLRPKISPSTKLIITGINPIWEPLMRLATSLRMRTPIQMKNFVTCKDIENILCVSGYEVIESGYRVFFPKKAPFISYFLNKLIPRLPLFKNLCVAQYIIARPKQELRTDRSLSCSVIIPCHNEEGNVRGCVEKVPRMGDYTEILVVDDGSQDKTAAIVKDMQNKIKNLRLVSYTPNRGKGHAVRTGFDSAKGDILIILDADMAVLPEELVKFYEVLASRQAEFVNGTRMIYDMAPGAMRFINFMGNKIFGIILSFIMGQRNTDTLCGTKAFYKSDYMNFRMGKCPWGDFDLLFGAAKMKLKTVEIPVHYYPRLEGESKMKAFRHGMQLLKMCWYGFWYLG
jgi:hypothetical protein